MWPQTSNSQNESFLASENGLLAIIIITAAATISFSFQMCMQGTEDNVDATFANAIRKKSTIFLNCSFPITSLTFLTGRELPKGHIQCQESLTRSWKRKVLKVTWHLLYPRVFKSVLSAEYTLKVGQFYLLWFELFTIFPSQWLVNNPKCHFIRIIINDCKFVNS